MKSDSDIQNIYIIYTYIHLIQYLHSLVYQHICISSIKRNYLIYKNVINNKPYFLGSIISAYCTASDNS